MNYLTDVITYIRRIIKSPSDAVISDNLIMDYINRFYINDIDARLQLFDLKTNYTFQTSPGIDQYNMPLYDLQTQPGSQTIGMYPVYQGFFEPAFINGIQVPFLTQKNSFFNLFPNVVQYMQAVITGDETSGPYTISFPIAPNNFQPTNTPVQAIRRGIVDISGIIATGVNQDPPLGTDLNFNIPSTSIHPAVYVTSVDANGNNVVVQDSGQFLSSNVNYGLLMVPGTAPFGYSALPNGASLPGGPYATDQNTINYFTGVITNLYFPVAIPKGQNINAQCYYFQAGLPRAILYDHNTFLFQSPPDQQYLVDVQAYLTPAAFLSTSAAVPFGYMSEYIARGAARKILSDTGDMEQFQFYEPFFLEQESLVWKRSQRQFTATRTETIYSQGSNFGQDAYNSNGGSNL